MKVWVGPHKTSWGHFFYVCWIADSSCTELVGEMQYQVVLSCSSLKHFGMYDVRHFEEWRSHLRTNERMFNRGRASRSKHLLRTGVYGGGFACMGEGMCDNVFLWTNDDSSDILIVGNPALINGLFWCHRNITWVMSLPIHHFSELQGRSSVVY